MHRILTAVGLTGAIGLCVSAQQPAPGVPVPVRPIRAATRPLPPEAASSNVTRFAFITYGDTRSPVDGKALQPDHEFLVDLMMGRIRAAASTRFPIRFVLQTGDAVTNGTDGGQWNQSFTPVIEKLTRRAGLPYFFTLGNHDVPPGPGGVSRRPLGLHNAISAMSQLIPPEGSARRLNGYLTYSFGFGNFFAIAIDSNVASDTTQLAWVTGQLDGLDRARYRHVVAFFHHPILTSGPHGGANTVEPPSAAMRDLYEPLFRKHQVRMTLTGHDHLFDHWIERYTDGGQSYRLDHVVTGGGGAPIYTYRGEPDVTAFLAAGADAGVRLEHPVRPGTTAAENPHHFVIIRIDGDRLSMEVVGATLEGYKPYNGQSGVDLNDR
jgi:3',5'-cyclic AMP phosphodiesterase CpdA